MARANHGTRARWAVVLVAMSVLTACGSETPDGLKFDSTTRPVDLPTSILATTTTPRTAESIEASAPVAPVGSISSPSTIEPAPKHFGTLPVGAALPSDEYCAAHVRPAKETRPENATFNATSGAAAPPQTGYFARVTGSFTGTTDEIIQWASCKWGIDEDIVRAQAAKESWWYQRTVSDFTDDPTRCVPDHGVGVDGKDAQCPESVGLLQLRYPYIPDAFPMVSESTSYNVDYALAYRRQCFEGIDTWFNEVDRGQDYAAGDIWGCVGAWFSGRWYASGAVEYTKAVRDYYDSKVWESGDFKSG